jgi:hypothetical protein
VAVASAAAQGVLTVSATLLTTVSLLAIVVLFLGLLNHNVPVFVVGLLASIALGTIHVARAMMGKD